MIKSTHTALLALFAVLALVMAGCSKAPEPAKDAAHERAQSEQAPPPAAQTPPPAAPEEKKPVEPPKPETAKPAKPAAQSEAPAGNTFRVRFDTSKGPFVIEVHRDWAPIGAKRFEDLVKDGFYNNARFFRVVPKFVVQFGLAANPSTTAKWNRTIKDDPVLQTNRIGSVVYATAGPNTRTTQLFINLGSNQFLDSQGFAPFGMVVEGMDVVQQLNAKYADAPTEFQGEITARGNAFLEAKFPGLDFIKTAKFE